MPAKSTKTKVEDEVKQEETPVTKEADQAQQTVSDPVPDDELKANSDPVPDDELKANSDPVPDDEEEKVLVAQTYILYLAHHYAPGETIPANDPDMVEAWLEAGSAEWVPLSEL